MHISIAGSFADALTANAYKCTIYTHAPLKSIADSLADALTTDACINAQYIHIHTCIYIWMDTCILSSKICRVFRHLSMSPMHWPRVWKGPFWVSLHASPNRYIINEAMRRQVRKWLSVTLSILLFHFHRLDCLSDSWVSLVCLSVCVSLSFCLSQCACVRCDFFGPDAAPLRQA